MNTSITSAVKLLTSVLIASLVMTSLVESACYKKSLSFERSSGPLAHHTGLSVYCAYGEERKQLFTAWVDLAACTRCFCTPSGMQCCGLGAMAGAAGCQGPL